MLLSLEAKIRTFFLQILCYQQWPRFYLFLLENARGDQFPLDAEDALWTQAQSC